VPRHDTPNRDEERETILDYCLRVCDESPIAPNKTPRTRAPRADVPGAGRDRSVVKVSVGIR
jgi:hypothetical protein